MSAGGSEQIRCIEVVELVSAYLDRELAEREVLRVEAHLRSCEGCTAYVEQMRATILALRRLDRAEAAGPDLAGVLAAYRARYDA